LIDAVQQIHNILKQVKFEPLSTRYTCRVVSMHHIAYIMLRISDNCRLQGCCLW